MCSKAGIEFVKRVVKQKEVHEKLIIEIGARDINGSVRPFIEALKPKEYIGVDMIAGPGVDKVMDATKLIGNFGANAFDVVISTEMLEHVKNWKEVINNMKKILRPNGILFLTTRSKGFKYHGWPWDFWRYEIEDMKLIFSDFIIENLESDPDEPGVFLKAVKPQSWVAKDLTGIQLYSIVTSKRIFALKEKEIFWLTLPFIPKVIFTSIMPKPIKDFIKKIIHYNS